MSCASHVLCVFLFYIVIIINFFFYCYICEFNFLRHKFGRVLTIEATLWINWEAIMQKLIRFQKLLFYNYDEACESGENCSSIYGCVSNMGWLQAFQCNKTLNAYVYICITSFPLLFKLHLICVPISILKLKYSKSSFES